MQKKLLRIFIHIFFLCFGSFFFCVGNLCSRKAHTRNPKREGKSLISRHNFDRAWNKFGTQFQMHIGRRHVYFFVIENYNMYSNNGTCSLAHCVLCWTYSSDIWYLYVVYAVYVIPKVAATNPI